MAVPPTLASESAFFEVRKLVMSDEQLAAPEPIIVSQTADDMQMIGTALAKQGFREAARLVYQAAAELDLHDSVLQESWGGPFNGQEKRCALFLDLVERT